MDGGNLAPLKVLNILYFLGYEVFRVVQDFLHPRYVLPYFHEPPDGLR